MKKTRFLFNNGRRLDYIIVLILLCVSGNMGFISGRRAEYVLAAFASLLAILLFMQKRRPFTQRFFLLFFLFTSILFIQSFSFSFFPVITIFGFLTRLFIGYAAFRMVNEFPRVYIDVLFYTCLLSLCFYAPDQICQAVGVDFRSLFAPLYGLVGVEDTYNMLLYNFQKYPNS